MTLIDMLAALVELFLSLGNWDLPKFSVFIVKFLADTFEFPKEKFFWDHQEIVQSKALFRAL